MSIITVPKALREKLGEDGSDALVDIINQSQGNQKADIIELVGESFERRLSEEIASVNQHIAGVEQRIEQLRTEFKEDNANLRSELKQDNADLRTEFKTDIANLRSEVHSIRADLIKWMFIFWIGQVATIAGLLFIFFR